MLVLMAELVSVFGPTFFQKVVPELVVGFGPTFFQKVVFWSNLFQKVVFKRWYNIYVHRRTQT